MPPKKARPINLSRAGASIADTAMNSDPFLFFHDAFVLGTIDCNGYVNPVCNSFIGRDQESFKALASIAS